MLSEKVFVSDNSRFLDITGILGVCILNPSMSWFPGQNIKTTVSPSLGMK